MCTGKADEVAAGAWELSPISLGVIGSGGEGGSDRMFGCLTCCEAVLPPEVERWGEASGDSESVGWVRRKIARG